ncbi:MAG: hypothetical protein AAF519_13865 [Bacteroidota bacterium]
MFAKRVKIDSLILKSKLVLIVVLFPCLSFCQEGNTAAGATVETDEIFQIVEIPPEFKGGEKKFIKFLKKNSKFHVTTQRSKGLTVYFEFIINKQGEAEQIKFLKKTPSNVQDEITRLLDLMPPWTPGMQKGSPVKVRLVKTLTFIFN